MGSQVSPPQVNSGFDKTRCHQKLTQQHRELTALQVEERQSLRPFGRSASQPFSVLTDTPKARAAA